jgi:hypothetical protein
MLWKNAGFRSFSMADILVMWVRINRNGFVMYSIVTIGSIL